MRGIRPIDRRQFLIASSALALATSARAGRPAVQSLRSAAAHGGRFYGAASATYQLADSDFAQVLPRETNMLVPEYELKRFLTEPSPGAFDFSAADQLEAFARGHGLKLRGHPLVWYAANPPWLEDAVLKSRDDRLLTGYVEKAASHFRGRMHSWDVVNEALAPEEGQAGGLRNSFWFKRYGASYIDLAFHAARAADPDAMLVYNDFGCEGGARENDVFRAATLKLIEGLRARNVPIDAYGLQGHCDAYGSPLDPMKLASFLSEIQAMGLKIIVTEHDVDDSHGPDDIAARDHAVADASRRFLEIVLDNKAVTGVLTWGLSDRYLKQPGMSAMLFSKGLRRLPLDPMLDRTPLWHAMATTLAV
jgi:endo-1,4-beta-xylanase